MIKVLIFGTFDHLHPGHLNFLTQAKALGDQLIVSVALDDVVENLKGHRPSQTLSVRMAALRQARLSDEIIPGDANLGAYTVIQEQRPDLVAFGYDQTELFKDFQRFQQVTGDVTPIVVLKPYRPDIYKSSLRRLAKEQQDYD
jgi:FAD synthetase